MQTQKNAKKESSTNNTNMSSEIDNSDTKANESISEISNKILQQELTPISSV